MAQANEAPSKLINTSSASPEFSVGLPVFFELVTRSKRVRAQAQLVGWIEPKYLFTTVPFDARLLIASIGSELIVRYLLDGKIYGFHSKLIHKQTDPTPLWTLKYPEIVEVKNLRRSPRIPLFLEMKTQHGEVWQSIDVSEHGACLAVDREQRIGTAVTLSFILPNGVTIENLTAKVMRTTTSKDECQVGIQFDEKDKDQLKTLRDYLNNIKMIPQKR